MAPPPPNLFYSAVTSTQIPPFFIPPFLEQEFKANHGDPSFSVLCLPHHPQTLFLTPEFPCDSSGTYSSAVKGAVPSEREGAKLI